MSTNVATSPYAGSSDVSDSSAGVKTIFKKSDRGSKKDDIKIVQQDPATKQKRSRLSRIFKPDKDNKSAPTNADETLTAAQKRRQQVYDAQKRHRNRHADYVKGLEAEVARLQHLDAIVNSEKNALAHQNNAIREFLAEQSLDSTLETANLGPSPQPSEDLSSLGGAAVDYRFDPEIGSERWFLDLPDLSWTSSSASAADSPPKEQLERHAPVTGDSWAALDFIMALEWPCRLHIYHRGISPNTNVPKACEVGEFHGHALTATQAVFQSAQAFPKAGDENSEWTHYNIMGGLHPNTADSWVLPHSEIDKLVELSSMLEVDIEYITPAQAYAAVREIVPSENFLRPTLQMLKEPLGKIVDCKGFGAGMDATAFWDHVESAIQTLRFTRLDLE